MPTVLTSQVYNAKPLGGGGFGPAGRFSAQLVPSAIDDLARGTMTSSGTSLSWTLPADTDNVEIYQRDVTASGSFDLIATLGAVTSYNVSGLTAESQYEWKAVATNANGSSTGNSVVSGTTNASVSGDWVVFSSNPEYAPLAGHEIYPRPDTETSANAYHRKMHTSRVFRVPCLLQGGGWPVKYEIISAPTGTTIGSELTRSIDSATGKILHERGETYSIVEYDPSGDSQNTVHSFHIRATDQQGNTFNWQWDSEVDNDAFRFCNSSTGNDAGTGTEGDPLQTFNAGVWKNDDNDATYQDKIIVFEGSFAISPATTDSTANLAGPKPIAFVSGPSGATFDMNNGHFPCTSGRDDFSCIGIDFDGSRSDRANNRIFGFVGPMNRFIAWGNSFDNTNPGTNGGDNPSHIFFGGQNATPENSHNNCVVFDCSLGPNAGMSLVQTFSTNFFLVEKVRGDDLSMGASNGAHLVQIKSSNRNVTVRDSYGKSSTAIDVFAISNAASQQYSSEEVELCFCTSIRTDSGSSIPSVIWNDGSNYDKHPTIAADYRNTVITESSWAWKFFDVANGIVKLSAAAYVGGIPSFARNYENVGSVSSVQLTLPDFDASGKLTGAARSTHLGSLGAEIASETS